jgi:hypothetical protein
MSRRRWWRLAAPYAVSAGLALAACDRDRDVAVTGPTASQGIVLERVELEEQFAPGRCVVKGTIRNDTGAGQRVTLVLHAFNGRGDDIAFAQPTIDFVPAGGRARFEARFRDLSDDGFLNDCDRVARVELLSVQLG